MTSSNPLQLPEILSRIFDFLYFDHQALRNAASVSHTWFEEAAGVLWSNPRPTELVKLPISRRQLYASKVQELSFDGDEEGRCHEDLKNLKFPRLKKVSLDAFRSSDGSQVVVNQYLQNSLEELAVYSGHLISGSLDHIASECRRLFSLSIDNIPESVDANQFLVFVQKITSLTHLCLMYGTDHAINDETLTYLMGHRNLICLDLGRYYGKETIERAIDEASAPIFKSLLRLRMRTDCAGLSSLVPLLGQLVTLFLDIDDDKGPCLRQLSSLKQLGVLGIRYCRSQEVSREEILALRSLHKLYSLSLEPIDGDVDALRTPDFTDKDFEQLVSPMKGLETFNFLIQNNVSVEAIASLGKHCRKLTILEMLGAYDLQELRHTQETLFPALVELDLGGASLEGPVEHELSAEEVVKLLKRHAPILECLYLQNNDKFSQDILAAFVPLHRSIQGNS